MLPSDPEKPIIDGPPTASPVTDPEMGLTPMPMPMPSNPGAPFPIHDGCAVAYAVPLTCPTPPDLWLVVFCPFCAGTHVHGLVPCEGRNEGWREADCEGGGQYELHDMTHPMLARVVSENYPGSVLARLVEGDVTLDEWHRIRVRFEPRRRRQRRRP